MHEYLARVLWERHPMEAFDDKRYSRRHRIVFDGGAEIAASSSPAVVPLPYSDASAVDPEEMFVASLASCHMLWFLALAAERGWRVNRYEDAAGGVMGPDELGRIVMTRVTLRPSVEFIGAQQPDATQVDALHHTAHERCFIANSVRTEVRCEPRAG